MAITDKEKGVWLNDQVYNKINQGSIWNYNGASGEAGAVWAWGGNAWGTMGGDRTDRSSPVQVLAGQYLKPMGGYLNGDNALIGGVNTSGEMWLVGTNSNGELAQNDSGIHRSSPVQVPGTWAYVYGTGGSGAASMSAINTDGELYTWGNNYIGGLGHNNQTKYSSPTQIPGTYLTSAGSFMSGGMANASIGAWVKSDNTLMMSGYNNYGGLGQSNTTQYSSPKQVPGTNWLRVSSDCYTTGAVRTDGTLYMWGMNGYGQCGNNDSGGGGPYWSPSPVKHLSTPNQVPGTTWSRISVGFWSSAAIRTDGTLWMWGRNNQGQLGQNTVNPSQLGISSPVQVGSGTDWSEVVVGSSAAQALKTDGTLWSWGYNSKGQLGNGEEANRYSSPVQIPGNWSALGWGGMMNAAVKP